MVDARRWLRKALGVRAFLGAARELAGLAVRTSVPLDRFFVPAELAAARRRPSRSQIAQVANW